MGLRGNYFLSTLLSVTLFSSPRLALDLCSYYFPIVSLTNATPTPITSSLSFWSFQMAVSCFCISYIEAGMRYFLSLKINSQYYFCLLSWENFASHDSCIMFEFLYFSLFVFFIFHFLLFWALKFASLTWIRERERERMKSLILLTFKPCVHCLVIGKDEGKKKRKKKCFFWSIILIIFGGAKLGLTV